MTSNVTQAPSCPKCGKPRPPEANACRRCGLVFALWKPAAETRAAMLDDVGESLWTAALADFSDGAKHDAFLKHCASADLLGPAGQRYRDWLDEHPGDSVATRMQARVVAMATVRLGVATELAKATKPATSSSRLLWATLLILTAGGLLAALLLGRGAIR